MIYKFHRIKKYVSNQIRLIKNRSPDTLYTQKCSLFRFFFECDYFKKWHLDFARVC